MNKLRFCFFAEFESKALKRESAVDDAADSCGVGDGDSDRDGDGDSDRDGDGDSDGDGDGDSDGDGDGDADGDSDGDGDGDSDRDGDGDGDSDGDGDGDGFLRVVRRPRELRRLGFGLLDAGVTMDLGSSCDGWVAW